ncbi:SET domain-containing protein, partial [Pseudomonas lactis]|nr:SET domain-containing protein [Pseudomonas lactis]
MNNALQRFYFKGLPEQQAHLDHLIDFVTEQSSLAVSSTELYYFPPLNSELNRECKEAVRVLAKLEADEDFQQFLREKPERDDSILGRDFLYDLLSTLLSSARSPIPDPPETFSIADHSVILRHIPTYWYIDADVLLDINRRVGNGVKSDGSVRFDLVLKYYSILPAQPKPPEQWKAVLQGLQEHHTLRKLGHDGQPSDLQHVLDAPADQKIKEVIREIETHTRQSLFRQVLPETFTASQQAMLTTTPTVLLEQLLNSPDNLALGERIAKALDWYGSQKDEICPQPVRVKLLWRALWLTIMPNTESPMDNELKLFIEPGASYSSIRHSLISRYEHSLSISPAAAQLAVCVVKANVASEVWVADIPDDLPYAASST